MSKRYLERPSFADPPSIFDFAVGFPFGRFGERRLASCHQSKSWVSTIMLKEGRVNIVTVGVRGGKQRK